MKFSEGPIKSINTCLLHYGDTNKSYQDRVKAYRDEMKINQGNNQNEKKVYKEININGKTAFIEFIEKDDIFYASDEIFSLASPLQLAETLPLEEKMKKSAEKFNKLVKYFEQKKIFFDKELV